MLSTYKFKKVCVRTCVRVIGVCVRACYWSVRACVIGACARRSVQHATEHSGVCRRGRGRCRCRCRAGGANTPIGFDVSLETMPSLSGSAPPGPCFELRDLHLSFDYDFVILGRADWGQYNIIGVFRDASDCISNTIYILPNIPLLGLFICTCGTEGGSTTGHNRGVAIRFFRGNGGSTPRRCGVVARSTAGGCTVLHLPHIPAPYASWLAGDWLTCWRMRTHVVHWVHGRDLPAPF